MYEPVHDPEHEQTISAAELWADPALQHLTAWLLAHDVSEDDAAPIVDTIWIFYSYYVLPGAGHPTRMAISVATDERTAALCLAFESRDQKHEEDVRGDFQHIVADPLASAVGFKLAILDEHAPEAFERQAADWSTSHGFEMIGVFQDRLPDELSVAIGEKRAKQFLNAPNVHLQGRRPVELLGTREDGFIRDVILAEKHSLPIWT